MIKNTILFPISSTVQANVVSGAEKHCDIQTMVQLHSPALTLKDNLHSHPCGHMNVK